MNKVKNFDYQQFYHQQDESMILKMIRKFEQMDQKIFLTRNKKKYVVSRFATRVIITLAGKFTFKRRIYRTWNQQQRKWNYIALLDAKVGLPKHCNLSIHLKQEIAQYLDSGKRYQDIIDIYKKANINKMTISRIYRNHFVVKNRQIKDLSHVNNLYINIDDTFVTLRKNKITSKYPIRLLTFYTDKVNKKLINPLLVPIFNPRQYDFETIVNKIKTIINLNFCNYSNTEMIIHGDGAPWIKKIAAALDGKFILDKFHAYHRIRRLMIKSYKSSEQKNNYQIATNYFKTGQFDKFIWFLKSKNPQVPTTYWNNNRLGIINQKLKENLGNVSEPMISANIKNLLGYGNKTFNYYTFKKMVETRCQNYK